MRQVLLAAVVALLVGAGAEAQQPAALVCPPGGYAPPMYGVFGQNGGGGQVSYEIASPCIPNEVGDAAEAIGMERNKPLGVNKGITIMFATEDRVSGQDSEPMLSIADFAVRFAEP